MLLKLKTGGGAISERMNLEIVLQVKLMIYYFLNAGIEKMHL